MPNEQLVKRLFLFERDEDYNKTGDYIDKKI